MRSSPRISNPCQASLRTTYKHLSRINLAPTSSKGRGRVRQ